MSLDSDTFSAILRRLADVRPIVVFGLIEAEGDSIYNTAVVVGGGTVIGRYRKVNLLPGERGAFTPGNAFPVFEVDGLTFGVNVCSDTQIAEPAAAVARRGARVILCLANNMMKRESAEKWKDRHSEVRAVRAKENGVWLVSADVTGERDGAISYGPTCAIDPLGHVVQQVPLMEVGMVVVEIG